MLRTSLLALLTIAMCACAGPSRTLRRADGQVLDTQRVDAKVAQLMQAAQVPGLALAIVADGRVVHLKAYGSRDLERGLPLQTDTVMYAASLTKAMFAYVVMTLVDEGRIDLDRSIAEYLPKPLPDYEKYADLAGDERWRELTPRRLLSHTSGFSNFRFFTPDGRYDEHGKLAFHVEPGTRYAYSGEGINLLQFVIEQGLGLDLAKLVQERVYDRYGMRRSGMTWRDDFAGNVAIGYAADGKALGHRQRRGVRAAGSMDTTPADYAAFLAAMQRGDGLSAKARDEMFAAQVRIDSKRQFPSLAPETSDDNRAIDLAYGLGWGRYVSPFGVVNFKEGGDDGWSNYSALVDGRGIGVLVMSNSDNARGIFKYLVDAVLGDTCMPWYWEGYIPYDRADLAQPAALQAPHPACGPVR
ncbi:MAG TPA: serine hydrolase domain-containing protein [Tahibacter sp.]|uniref:serine hydrolase domain-containing protein n=1 Tax=Tahibacter sp. TaxID=2056211 RepID=UPI002BB4D155|nr:serine hydrolase domain-containing protein [Tahibacter sp.]HSX62071.1 serine hydrolase domain-containing protein [Tahibacter sp.]